MPTWRDSLSLSPPASAHSVNKTKLRGDSMKLHRNERCPIHNSFFCCGRGPKRRNPSFPVQRVDDPHHPRGYRELRSPAEMRKLLVRKITEQEMKCGICKRRFTHCSDIVPDHISPKGIGSAWRDDHPDNIQAAHRRCNFEKGSRRLKTC
jgi:hypothetical protein